MFSFPMKSLFGLCGSLLLAGYQSSGAPTPAAHTMVPGAVQCDKCQVTWVKTAETSQGG